LPFSSTLADLSETGFLQIEQVGVVIKTVQLTSSREDDSLLKKILANVFAKNQLEKPLKDQTLSNAASVTAAC